MNENNSRAESFLPRAFHALVLLVDDQVMVAEMVKRALGGQTDIDFHYCDNPLEALAVASRIRPTVILLDLVMPQLTGLELLRRFREHPDTEEIPIVVLSAAEEPQTKSDAFAFGANDYLVKLPDALELRARVRYHSRARILQLQRDEAFHALRKSQQRLVEKNTELIEAGQKAERALAQVTQLQGLLPICCYCHKVRNDQQYWQQIEGYLAENTRLRFTHGMCPDCYEKAAKELDPVPGQPEKP